MTDHHICTLVYRYVEVAPSVETDEDQLNLINREILHAFDQTNIQGWFKGRISSRGVSRNDLRKAPNANFVVTYDKRVTHNNHLHGRVASTLIPSKYGPTEWWLLLERV